MNIVIKLNDLYLRDCDFEAFNGRGHAHWTNNPANAKKFANSGDAFDYWRTRSKTNPTRPDGKPNRPLTAFTVEISAL